MWRDIAGYENKYKISSYGNVYSVKRDILLAPADCKGYLVVTLYTGKSKSLYKVHRLVANAFIPNPLLKPTVNHKDEDKHNNNSENLEWATTKENNNHGTRMKRANEGHKIPILQFDTDGNFIREWDSNVSISKALGIGKGNIWACCVGRYNHANGFVWKYANAIGG